MSSKTVWVVGGLVLAVGAVAYLSYHETPSGKDAAGTIVEAKRAISESPSSSTVPSGAPGDSSADSNANPRDATQDNGDRDSKSRSDRDSNSNRSDRDSNSRSDSDSKS